MVLAPSNSSPVFFNFPCPYLDDNTSVFIANLRKALDLANGDLLDLSLRTWQQMPESERVKFPVEVISILNTINVMPDDKKYYAAEEWACNGGLFRI